MTTVTLPSAFALIDAERARQINVEGWTPEHDREHGAAVLRAAGASYYCASGPTSTPLKDWPWSADWWKPSTPLRNLVRAGALAQAALDITDPRTDPATYDELTADLATTGEALEQHLNALTGDLAMLGVLTADRVSITAADLTTLTSIAQSADRQGALPRCPQHGECPTCTALQNAAEVLSEHEHAASAAR